MNLVWLTSNKMDITTVLSNFVTLSRRCFQWTTRLVATSVVAAWTNTRRAQMTLCAMSNAHWAFLCSECLVLVCLQCGVWGVWTVECPFAHLHICWVSICTSVASVLSFGTHSHVGGDLYFYTWAPPIKVFTAELWSDMTKNAHGTQFCQDLSLLEYHA